MWLWRPRIRRPVLFVGLAIIELLASCAVFVDIDMFGSRTGAILVMVLLNLLIAFPMLYAAQICGFNLRLREGVCWCLCEAAQGKDSWKMRKNAEQAKRPFFQWEVNRNFTLVV